MAPAGAPLAGLVVAVTGAARGIGAATAESFLGQGARVVIGDIDEPTLGATGERLGVSACHVLDVTDRDSFARFLAATEEQVGPVDVLVNNAGIMPTGSILDEADDVTRRVIEINLLGPMTGTKLALASMVPRRRGHIVNVASMAGENYGPGVASYCASKYGLLGFTDSIRLEVRSSGVNVSAILPGPVDTELIAGMKTGPGVRPVSPGAVASAIVDVVRRPRAHVYVPRSAGAMLGATRLLPRGMNESIKRALGFETIFFGDLDTEARQNYEAAGAGSERVRSCK